MTLSVEFIEGFSQSLVKQAGGAALLATAKRLATSPGLRRGVWGAGSGLGAGALAGAGLGAVGGGVQGYATARRQGAGVGDAALQALDSGVRGAVRGGAVGGLVGTAAGAAAPGAAETLLRAPGLGAGARFGQRQVHGLTGWLPQKGLRAIGGGGDASARELVSAADALRKARGAGQGVSGATKGLHRAAKAHEAAVKAENMGLTSLPGYARALRSSPVDALKAGFGEQWHSTSPGMRALVYGGTGVQALGAARGSDNGSKGRLERVGEAVGTSLPLMAGPLPTAATLVAAPVAGVLGGLVGKVGDKARRRLAHQTSPAHSSASLVAEGSAAVPAERTYSDRTTGNIDSEAFS